MQYRVLLAGHCNWGGVPLLFPGETAPPRSVSPVPRGTSSFEFFFQPIIGSLAAYWWVDPFNWLDTVTEPEADAAWRAVTSDGMAPPGAVLPKFSRYMREDWCEVIGFLDCPPPDEVELFRNFTRCMWEADLTFQNIDGAFWRMHSRNTQLMRVVDGYLKNIPGAKCSYELIDSTL